MCFYFIFFNVLCSLFHFFGLGKLKSNYWCLNFWSLNCRVFKLILMTTNFFKLNLNFKPWRVLHKIAILGQNLLGASPQKTHEIECFNWSLQSFLLQDFIIYKRSRFTRNLPPKICSTLPTPSKMEKRFCHSIKKNAATCSTRNTKLLKALHLKWNR